MTISNKFRHNPVGPKRIVICSECKQGDDELLGWIATDYRSCERCGRKLAHLSALVVNTMEAAPTPIRDL